MTPPDEVAQPWIDRIAGCKNRNEAAVVYAEAIGAHPPGAEGPWSRINAAIKERWSMSGLAYIKERAWKILE